MKLVIFDMDGTIVDSVALLIEAVNAAFDGLGQAIPEDKVIRSISGLNLDIGMSILAPDADDARVFELAASYKNEYLSRVTATLREPLFPGADDVLNALAKRDDTLLAVATGKESRGAHRVLNTHDLVPLFTSIQTPDTNLSKPNPEMIYSAMSAVGVEKMRTVMIGDTNHDIEMAVNAGVPSIGVSWGFHEVDELEAAGAHAIIDDYGDMIETIDRLLGN